MKLRLNSFFLFIIGLTAMHLTWYAMISSRMSSQLTQLKGLDFIGFYTGGRIVASGNLGHVYDLDTQLLYEQESFDPSWTMSDLMWYNHPPIMLPFLFPLGFVDFHTAYVIWVVFNGSLLILIGVLVGKYLHSKGLGGLNLFALVLGMLLFYPTFIGILKGQDTPFILLGLFLWAYGILREKPYIVGAGLVLIALKPQIAVFLSIPFIFKQRKVLLWALGAAAVDALFFLPLGLQGLRNYLNILGLAGKGVGYYINRFAMFNLTGILTRSEVTPDLTSILGWVGFTAGVIIVCVFWARSVKLGFKEITLAIVMAIFFSPHLHYHDLALLAVPLLAIPLVFKEYSNRRFLFLIPFLTSFMFIVLDSTQTLRYIFAYLLMLFLILLQWFPQSHLRVPAQAGS